VLVLRILGIVYGLGSIENNIGLGNQGHFSGYNCVLRAKIRVKPIISLKIAHSTTIGNISWVLCLHLLDITKILEQKAITSAQNEDSLTLKSLQNTRIPLKLHI